MSGKLHELLAVESDLAKVATTLTDESSRSFKKDHLFTGEVKTHTLYDEKQKEQELPVQERKVESTVAENLVYLFDEGLSPLWDAVLQKDEANQRAKADIIIDGVTIAKDVPGVTLLGLESKLSALLPLLRGLPTLAPGIAWSAATNEREGISISPVDVRPQTIKEPDVRVLYEATDKHPAQLREFERTVNVGKWEVISFSGAISSVKKAEYIKKLQTLISAVKKARQRANTVETTDVHIGKALSDYLLG